MQILGKRSKILLIAVAIAMLAALGLSFALWDTNAVKAAGGSTSTYANAKVGDIVTFGNYYQQANSAEKTAIEWIVVDKDERTGQLTVMSKYILAYGSYFGNYYLSVSNGWSSIYQSSDGKSYNLHDLVAGLPYNQAWVESNARAFLNNLERFDLGGDMFNAAEGLSATRLKSRYLDLTTANDEMSMRKGELLTSVGYSNAKYWTGLSYADADVKTLVGNNPEFSSRRDTEAVDEVYYRRAKITDPNQRLARNGFYEEAFTAEEKQLIVPRTLPGTISHRWPDSLNSLDSARYVEGTTDKIWLPSAEELNIREGYDWTGRDDDAWTAPSELSASVTFNYFKDYKSFNFASISEALKATHTDFAAQGSGLGNYSIPGFIPTEQISTNTSNYYWTRSPSSTWVHRMRIVGSTGAFSYHTTDMSHIGIRPCLLLKY